MANACDLQSGKADTSIGTEQDSVSVVQEILVNNVARNKKSSFHLPVTLWVYGTKVQATGLANSGATTNFIDYKLIEKKHLITNKLARLYNIQNVDETLNVVGQIGHFVRALVQIGEHKSTIYLYVADLGDKDLIIGYDYLY